MASIWAHQFVQADAISDRTGVPTSDLYLMNQSWAPDPLELLLENEAMEPKFARFTDTAQNLRDRLDINFTDDGLKTLRQMLTERNIAYDKFDLSRLTPTGPDESITPFDVSTVLAPRPQKVGPQPGDVVELTERTIDIMTTNAQELYLKLVYSGTWVASMLKEGFDPDYIPDITDTENAIAVALEGVESYAYNRDAEGSINDPSRKGLTGSAWNILESHSTTVVRNMANLDALEDLGFFPSTSYEDAFSAAYQSRLTSKENRGMRQTMREQRFAGAAASAREAVKAKVGKLLRHA